MFNNIILSVFYVLLYSIIMACLVSLNPSIKSAYVGIYMAMVMVTIVFINMSKDHINLTISQLREWVARWN